MPKSRFQIGDYRPDMSEDEVKALFADKSEEELNDFLDEVKKTHARAESMVTQRAALAKQQFGLALRYAEDGLAHTERQLSEVEASREAARAFQDTPDGAVLFGVNSLLAEAYTAARNMMAVEAACARHNMLMTDIAAQGIPTDPSWSLRVAHEDLDYRAARSAQDAALARASVATYRLGAEVLMRAVFGESVYPPLPGEEQSTEAHVDRLKASMREDVQLAQAVTLIATDIQEAIALAEWAKVSLQTLGHLPAQARRKALDDPDWSKLNGKVLSLCDLAEKAGAYPALAELFPRHEAPPLPFEPVSWDTAKRVTGPRGSQNAPLRPPGGTGPKVGPKSGPLGGPGPRAPQTGRLPNNP